MSNPFLMIKADIKRNIFSFIGIFLLLAFACSLEFVANTFIRSTISSFSDAASDYDLVIGSAGSRNDLVLSSVFLRIDSPLPILDASYITTLANDERVDTLSPLIFSDSYSGYQIVGVGSDFLSLRTSFSIEKGMWFEDGFSAVIGSDVPLAIGESFSTSHDGSDDNHGFSEYRAVGKLGYTGTPWDRAILVPYESLWRVHGVENGGVSAILVKPVDFPSAYSLRAEYMEGGTISVFPGEVLSSLFTLFDNIEMIARGLGRMIELLVGAAAIISIIATLPSKYKWIGLLRSLGAGRAYIFFTLYFQSGVIFFFSGLGGFFLGGFVSQYLSSMIDASTGLKIMITFGMEDVLSLLGFWAIGFIGALIPSLIGFSLQPRTVLLSH